MKKRMSSLSVSHIYTAHSEQKDRSIGQFTDFLTVSQFSHRSERTIEWIELSHCKMFHHKNWFPYGILCWIASVPEKSLIISFRMVPNDLFLSFGFLILMIGLHWIAAYLLNWCSIVWALAIIVLLKFTWRSHRFYWLCFRKTILDYLIGWLRVFAVIWTHVTTSSTILKTARILRRLVGLVSSSIVVYTTHLCLIITDCIGASMPIAFCPI